MPNADTKHEITFKGILSRIINLQNVLSLISSIVASHFDNEMGSIHQKYFCVNCVICHFSFVTIVEQHDDRHVKAIKVFEANQPLTFT